jgi:hypothetical protein
LLLEHFPARHRDDANADAFGLQSLARVERERDFGAGGDDDELRRGGLAFCVGVGET